LEINTKTIDFFSMAFRSLFKAFYGVRVYRTTLKPLETILGAFWKGGISSSFKAKRKK